MTEVIVKHITFGKGFVIFQDDKYIKIKFEDEEIGEKIFIYPDAFFKFIAYDDENLQKEITEKLSIIKQKRDEADEKARIEEERLEAEEKARIKAILLKNANTKSKVKHH